MTEAEILKVIMKECLEYKTNFRYIDDLTRREGDYYAAKSGTYEDFSSCPTSYDVLEDAPEMCMIGNEKDYDCDECWRNAVRYKVNKEEENRYV